MTTAAPQSETRYDVSLDPTTLGLLLGEERSGEGVHCWRAIAGRCEPCDACPVLGGNRDAMPAVMLHAQRPGVVRVLNAAVEGDVAHVVVWDLAPATVSRIVRLRLDSLIEGARLTVQERRVLDPIVLGTPSKEVASRLGISPRTVKFHAANIFKKLGLQSRQDLLRLLLVAVPATAARPT
jgi:DNA-binding CsgD family transcriptional regulator